MTAVDSINRVRQHCRTKGLIATVLAAAEMLLSPVLRRRRRVVFEASTVGVRQASPWAANERLLLIGPDNLDTLDPALLANLRVEKHQRDFDGIRHGNRLFLVVDGNECIHRSYVRLSEGLLNDRKSLFFGELEMLPEIRSCETAERSQSRGLYRRVLNEALRYVQSLGYSRAVLYVMAENTASIKGVRAAGFTVCRELQDWILFNLLVIQNVSEAGDTAWRIFLR
jgi:hypothetical protein